MREKNLSITGSAKLFSQCNDKVASLTVKSNIRPLLTFAACCAIPLTCLSACMPGFIGVTKSGLQRKPERLLRDQ